MMFYVCLGKMPKEVIELPFKKNSSFTFVLVVSFICHIYILCRFAIRNFQEKKSEQTQTPNLSIQHYLRDRIQKESLFRLVLLSSSCTIFALDISMSIGSHESRDRVHELFAIFLGEKGEMYIAVAKVLGGCTHFCSLFHFIGKCL
jgi:hypothetical protein